jgi:uncharacterized tellurite resistance protein B-like protein
MVHTCEAKRTAELNQTKMNITKSEAIVMLAMSAGNADGEFSLTENEDAITKTPALKEAMKDAEQSDWLSKYRTKELSAESAVKALGHLPADDKTEAMAICWEIVLSDGKISDEERKLIEGWSVRLGITLDDVIAKHKRMYL